MKNCLKKWSLNTEKKNRKHNDGCLHVYDYDSFHDVLICRKCLEEELIPENTDFN